LLGRRHRDNTFWVDILLNKDSCPKKLVFLCLILELKLIGLDSVDVVLEDVETKQVENKDSK
jgi:hypothetical protein